MAAQPARLAAARRGDYAGFPAELPAAPPTLPVEVIAGKRSAYCTLRGSSKPSKTSSRPLPRAMPVSRLRPLGTRERPDDFVALVDAFCAEGEPVSTGMNERRSVFHGNISSSESVIGFPAPPGTN